jgi:hypothetical protein
MPTRPPYGMEKEVSQVRTHEYIQPAHPFNQPTTSPYNPYNSPTTVQPQYQNNMPYIKPGCFREKKPCAGCPWRHECGNVENCHQEDK